MNKKYCNSSKPQDGFTLIELMVTVAIITAIAALALPSYLGSVDKSRRSDAQGALTSFANAMERHFTTNSTYEGAAGTQGSPSDTGSPWIFETEAPLDGDTKYYDLTIESASASAYTLRATPKGAQADNGMLELTSTGIHRWDEDNSGTFDTDENKWRK
jgi:type IV pilus assembly protein PilE